MARLAGSQDEVVFADRREAGRRLAAALLAFRNTDPVVLGLPRGGVPVAYEVAEALGAPLDIVLVRKIGAQGHAELGLGAVVEGNPPELVLNDEIVQSLDPSPAYIEAETKRQIAEIERRKILYREGRAPAPIEGRAVIVVDDGIATGGTARAVLKGLRRAGAKQLILAVPVAPADVIETLSLEGDEVICLATPPNFVAVGLHYRDFGQTTDAEVVDLLRKADARIAEEQPRRL